MINYTIDKRYSDFVTFTEMMKPLSKARPPPLPQKLMVVKDIKKIEQRGALLCQWLQIVVNEKMFHNKLLYDFIGLPKNFHSDHLTAKPLGFLERDVDVTISIMNNHQVKSVDSKESFVLFDISVTVNSRKTRELISSYMVKRRFREFDNLNQRLKKKFVKYNRPLPDFPNKFGLKKNIKKR